MAIEHTFDVIISKAIKVQLPDEFGTEAHLRAFREVYFPVDSVVDVAKYAADMAARGYEGQEIDGLGLLNTIGSTYPRMPDVGFEVLAEDVEINQVIA